MPNELTALRTLIIDRFGLFPIADACLTHATAFCVPRLYTQEGERLVERLSPGSDLHRTRSTASPRDPGAIQDLALSMGRRFGSPAPGALAAFVEGQHKNGPQTTIMGRRRRRRLGTAALVASAAARPCPLATREARSATDLCDPPEMVQIWNDGSLPVQTYRLSSSGE